MKYKLCLSVFLWSDESIPLLFTEEAPPPPTLSLLDLPKSKTPEILAQCFDDTELFLTCAQ